MADELTENMIRWAENKLGSRKYDGWCLSFIEDALEKSNVIEIFGGDSAIKPFLEGIASGVSRAWLCARGRDRCEPGGTGTF